MFTAIISDLHLTEAEPVRPKKPYWKKYKSKEFFFDTDFSAFLLHLNHKAKGEKVELILNGDIFDFDSIMQLPDYPDYQIRWIEKLCGLYPRPERSAFKMEVILKEHPIFFQSLRDFILRGNEVVFIIGNHDAEMHFFEVQDLLKSRLDLPVEMENQFRICSWFYVSNNDTLVEHGHQYDPYCVFEDPINPVAYGENFKTLRLPFGDMTCRYMLNGMGYFNPHVDSNYIMDFAGYIRFFLKYVIKTQPLLAWTWFWRSVYTLWLLLYERFSFKKKAMGILLNNRISEIAKTSQAQPLQIYQLNDLAVLPASHSPFALLQELWLDRAFIVLIGLGFVFEIFLLIRQVYEISFYWSFLPLLTFLPFFIFYSQSVVSKVADFKEPDDLALVSVGQIFLVDRVVHGHTHEIKHDYRGAVEYLNSGTWSPAFIDVECTQKIETKTFVWIEKHTEIRGKRWATVRTFIYDSKQERFLSYRLR